MAVDGLERLVVVQECSISNDALDGLLFVPMPGESSTGENPDGLTCIE
jgi:hypothetical protein